MTKTRTFRQRTIPTRLPGPPQQAVVHAPEHVSIALKAHTLIGGRSKSPQSPLKPQPGGAYPYLGDDLLGLPLNQQFDANQILLEDPFTLPNAAIIENMIYSPTNLDWVG